MNYVDYFGLVRGCPYLLFFLQPSVSVRSFGFVSIGIKSTELENFIDTKATRPLENITTITAYKDNETLEWRFANVFSSKGQSEAIQYGSQWPHVTNFELL